MIFINMYESLSLELRKIMSVSKKYKRYGIRRDNNLSDLQDPAGSLNSLLDNIEGSIEGGNFISDDLDAIRGLRDTNITTEIFSQIQGTAAYGTNTLTGERSADPIIPRLTIQDRLNRYRQVTGSPSTYGSGLGPRATFVPSSNISVPTKGDAIEDILQGVSVTNNTDTVSTFGSLETSDEFWTNGEFFILDRIDPSFDDLEGGIIWEGYFLKDVLDATLNIGFVSSGLFHIEVDQFDDGNWIVEKSIYDQTRSVQVETTSSSNIIELKEGEGRFVAQGDFISNTEIEVTEVSGDNVTLSDVVSVTADDFVDFTFDLGEDTINENAVFRSSFDRDELVKVRIFWWFPSGAVSNNKYLRLTYTSSSSMLFYQFSRDKNTADPGIYEIRKLLEDGLKPYDYDVGSSGNLVNFISSSKIESNYVPANYLNMVNRPSGTSTTNVEVSAKTRYITNIGSSFDTSIIPGDVIIPVDLDFSVIPKWTAMKDYASRTGVSSRMIIDRALPDYVSDPSPVEVRIVDRNGLVDYFDITSSGNTVTIQNSSGDTSLLRKGMLCFTGSTGSGEVIRIDEILNSTSFTTDSALGAATNSLCLVYSNSGIIDTSKDVFCDGVFGRVVATQVSSGNVISMTSVDGIQTGMVVQLDTRIPSGTTVTQINANDITLSNSVTGTIKASTTIAFAPSGTSVNKEACVIPLDLSPPFVGIDEGLSTNGLNISSSTASLEVSALNVKIENASFPEPEDLSTEEYDSWINVNALLDGTDTAFRIKAKKIV